MHYSYPELHLWQPNTTLAAASHSRVHSPPPRLSSGSQRAAQLDEEDEDDYAWKVSALIPCAYRVRYRAHSCTFGIVCLTILCSAPQVLAEAPGGNILPGIDSPCKGVVPCD